MVSNNNFDSIILNAYIDTYFQPIVNLLNGSIIGYEALSRGPKGSDYFLPNTLITEAKARNRMQELDLIFRKMALMNASKRGLRKLLFINIDPLAIYTDNTVENVVRRSSEYGIAPKRIVVEVSERSALCSFEKFQKAMDEYRRGGYTIAFDDINAALSNIDTVSSIKPKYIKIDGKFVKGINLPENTKKVEELSPIITIAKMIGAKVIAVGVEKRDELRTLYRIGVDAAQGNLIGIPQKEFKPITEDAQILLNALHEETNSTTIA